MELAAQKLILNTAQRIEFPRHICYSAMFDSQWYPLNRFRKKDFQSQGKKFHRLKPFKIEKQRYLPHCYLDKCLKGTVVNCTCLALNVCSPKIMYTVPLIIFLSYLLYKKMFFFTSVIDDQCQNLMNLSRISNPSKTGFNWAPA